MAVLRGRFAPSPTGEMHLGNARTALLTWLDARSGGGALVLRIEDLDRPRVAAGAEARLLEDLAWLGLDWDEGPDRGGGYAPYRQSERAALYDAAIERLLVAGRAFPCACSRADVARAASAPHESLVEPLLGEDERRYPGTCRGLAAEEVQRRAAGQGRAPAIRFDGAGAGKPVGFEDELRGLVGEDWGPVDDFVLRRADGVAAYQLAVVVDDAAMEITRVVRGDDLLRSTPRQLALYEALGLEAPAFAHVPLLLAPGGERLAKRTRPASVASLRAAGVPARRVIGALAASAGLAPTGAEISAKELLPGFDLRRIDRQPAVVSAG